MAGLVSAGCGQLSQAVPEASRALLPALRWLTVCWSPRVSSPSLCSHTLQWRQGVVDVPGFFYDFLGQGQALSAQTRSGSLHTQLWALPGGTLV